MTSFFLPFSFFAEGEKGWRKKRKGRKRKRAKKEKLNYFNSFKKYMFIFERKIKNNFITLILCLKNTQIQANKCIIKHIYEMCNRYIQISDLFQSSITSRVEIEALEFKCEIFYKIESEFCSLIFYDGDFKPVKPRINYRDKFSFFIDKKLFLPSYVHLFIHFCMDEVDCFSDIELFQKKNARLPLLSLKEQKSFLINLLKPSPFFTK